MALHGQRLTSDIHFPSKDGCHEHPQKVNWMTPRHPLGVQSCAYLRFRSKPQGVDAHG
ncbi:unnamed protein product, partial [Arabidopsis halleri]